MNVFILDPNPTINALYHCDQHIAAACREYGQILAAALCLRGESHEGLPRWQGQTATGAPNRNRFHVWAAEEPGALAWLTHLWLEIHGVQGHTHPRAAAAVALYRRMPTPEMPARMELCERGRALAGTTQRVPIVRAVAVYREIYREKAAAWAAAGRPMRFAGGSPAGLRAPAWMGAA